MATPLIESSQTGEIPEQFDVIGHIETAVTPLDKAAVLDQARQLIGLHNGQLGIKGRLLAGCTELTEVVTLATDAVHDLRSSTEEMQEFASDDRQQAEQFETAFGEKHEEHIGPVAAFADFVFWIRDMQGTVTGLTDDITATGLHLQTLVHKDFPDADDNVSSLRNQKNDTERMIEVSRKLAGAQGANCTIALKQHLNDLEAQLRVTEAKYDAADTRLTDLVIDIDDTRGRYQDVMKELGELEQRFASERQTRIDALHISIDSYFDAIKKVLEAQRQAAAEKMSKLDGLFGRFMQLEAPQLDPAVDEQDSDVVSGGVTDIPTFTRNGSTTGLTSVSFAYGIQTNKGEQAS